MSRAGTGVSKLNHWSDASNSVLTRRQTTASTDLTRNLSNRRVNSSLGSFMLMDHQENEKEKKRKRKRIESEQNAERGTMGDCWHIAPFLENRGVGKFSIPFCLGGRNNLLFLICFHQKKHEEGHLIFFYFFFLFVIVVCG